MRLHSRSPLNENHGSSQVKVVMRKKEMNGAIFRDNVCRVKIKRVFRQGTENNKAPQPSSRRYHESDINLQ